MSGSGPLYHTGDCSICVWRVSSGECIKRLTGYSRAVWSVVFSLNGEYLASGSEDNSIVLWKFFN